jgi:hypothetical protein
MRLHLRYIEQYFQYYVYVVKLSLRKLHFAEDVSSPSSAARA